MTLELTTYSIDEFTRRSTKGGPKPLLQVLETLPAVMPHGPWIAGGAVRRLLISQPLDSDFDFFFRDEAQASEFESALAERGFEQIFKTEQSITWRKGKVIVQSVKIGFYATIGDLLDSFDFTICQCAYDGANLHVGPHTLWDLGRMRLAVHSVSYAAATVRRLIKYEKQGFKACEGAIVAILEAVAKDPSLIHASVQYVD